MPVGQSRVQPDRHWLEPVRGGRSVKVHCCQRCWSTSVPIRVGGLAKEGEIGSARTREVGEGLGDFLEERKGICRRDLEGVRVGLWFTWGRVLWREYKRAAQQT